MMILLLVFLFVFCFCFCYSSAVVIVINSVFALVSVSALVTFFSDIIVVASTSTVPASSIASVNVIHPAFAVAFTSSAIHLNHYHQTYIYI